MAEIAETPEPPYYAVIFTSLRTEECEGYAEMAIQMLELAKEQPGFLGVESAREDSGLGVTVSYWEDEASISVWKRQMDHQAAQRLGKDEWYKSYTVRVSKVERAYGFIK